MNEYLNAIIVISIATSLFEALMPSGGRLGKYTQYIGLLCILCVIITPIGNFLRDLDGGFLEELKEEILDDNDKEQDYEQILIDYVNNHSISELKQFIKDELNKNFMIPKEECEVIVHVGTTNSKLELIRIDIILSGASIFKNPYEIEGFISNMTGCECIVTIK